MVDWKISKVLHEPGRFIKVTDKFSGRQKSQCTPIKWFKLLLNCYESWTIGCPELNPVAALKNVNGNDHANGDINEKEKAEEPNKRKDDQSAVNP